MPTCLDSYFCEKFIKSFDLNINLLCTLYHSLNHYEIISKDAFIQTNRTNLRRRRSCRVSTKCTRFMSKSRKPTKIISKYRKLSPSSQTTIKYSKLRSNLSLKNSKIEDLWDSSRLKIFKRRLSSFMKASSKKYKVSTNSQKPRVNLARFRVTNACLFPTYPSTLLSSGPTRTSSWACNQSL